MTKISWADESWNPICGCSKISAGCANCYAERQAYRLICMGIPHYEDTINVLEPPAYKWSGETVFVESALTKPLHWRKPRKIFVVSMGDLFHESVPFEWIVQVLHYARFCAWHQFMILTKRHRRMREFFEWYKVSGVDVEQYMLDKHHDYCMRLIKEDRIPRGVAGDRIYYDFPAKNIHLGVTVENQDNVGRIADLRATPAAGKFVSLEPLLCGFDVDLTGIDAIYIGCESGSDARLCKLMNIRYMIRQGQKQAVKIHIKQIPLNGKCNKHIKEWPKEFQIREV